MTKKDYETIAAAARVARARTVKGLRSDIQNAGISLFVDELCEQLKIDNPRFDARRFKEACE